MEAQNALGSLLIGVLLGGVSIALATVTHGLLIGKTAPTDDHADVLALAEGTEGVERVTQLLSVHLGPEVVVLTMKVAFKPATSVQEVEDITNEMERRIRAHMPRMRKIFIEVDSKGDGRGIEAARAILAQREKDGLPRISTQAAEAP